MNKKIIGAAIVITALLPMLAAAQGSGITQPISPPVGANFSIQSVIATLNQIVIWVFTIFLIVAVLFVLWAAFTYLMAGGNEEKVGEATNRLIYAAVAIAVALLSVAIRFIVEQLVGAPIQ